MVSITGWWDSSVCTFYDMFHTVLLGLIKSKTKNTLILVIRISIYFLAYKLSGVTSVERLTRDRLGASSARRVFPEKKESFQILTSN